MEIKKTPPADLENERTTFLLLGFVVVLATFFVVLEWQSQDTIRIDRERLDRFFVEEEFQSLTPVNPLSPEEEPLDVVSQPVAVLEGYHIVDSTEKVNSTKTGSPEDVVLKNEETEAIPVPESDSVPVLFAEAEIMPEFRGGQAALLRYIYQETQYPSAAVKQRIQGRVLCSFIINKDGTVSDAQLVKRRYSFLDDEALRVIRNMPVWNPGVINGKKVRVKYYLPIMFRL